MLRSRFIWAVLVAVSLLLSACARLGPQAGQLAEPVKLTVEMSEYAFTPNELQVKVGQEVTIELTNTGVLAHELMLGRDVKMNHNRPDGYEHDLFETAGVEPVVTGSAAADPAMEGGHGSDHTGVMVTLLTGAEKAALTFTVTRDMIGEWEMGCFEQEGVHYTAGMKGKFVVTP